MKFPHGNKIEQPLSEKFGETAKVFENHLKNLDVRLWIKSWAVILVLVCVSLFAIVFSVSFALWIF